MISYVASHYLRELEIGRFVSPLTRKDQYAFVTHNSKPPADYHPECLWDQREFLWVNVKDQTVWVYRPFAQKWNNLALTIRLRKYILRMKEIMG